MKMIKPLDGVMNLATSDAPMDALATWAPVGRNEYDNLNVPSFGIAGDVLFVSGYVSSSPAILMQNTITGANLGHIPILRPMMAPTTLRVSPDGQFVSFLAGGSFVVMDVATKLEVFASSEGGLQDIVISWISTLGFYIAGGKDVYLYDGSTNTSSKTVDMGSFNYPFPYIAETARTTIDAIVYGGFAVCSVFLLFAGNPSDNRNFITKKDGLGPTHLSYNLGAGKRSTRLLYNSVRDTVIVFLDDGGVIELNFSDMTLVTDGKVGALTNFYTDKKFSMSTSGSEMLIRYKSTSPYWVFLNLSDYSFNRSAGADTRESQGTLSGIGTTNYVIQKGSFSNNKGLSFFANSGNTRLSEVLPEVVAGDRYIYDSNVYEVLVDNQVNPLSGIAATPPTWLDRGFINPLRMFDGKLDSVTTAPGTLNVSIAASSLIGALAVFNVEAATIQVKMTDPTDGLVYDSGLIDMQGGNSVDNWFDYFFAPYIPKSDYAIIDFPAYPEATIAVEMVALNGTVKLGELVLGRTYDLGMAQYGTSVGIIDFSRKETDEFGNFKILKRRFSKRAEYDIKVDSRRISAVQRTLADMRAEPAVYIGDIMREETIIYGFFRSFDIVISAPSISDATITVEGL